MTADELVRYEVRDRIAYLTLNRPDRLNALNLGLLQELRAALYRLDVDDDADLAILSGAGRAFCAGADIHEWVGTPEARGNTPEPSSSLLLSRFELYKPIIAAVHGHAVGAGLILVLHCDLVVCDETAQFRIIEVARGLDGSSLWAYLKLRVPGAVADDLALTGRVCHGPEAVQIGLANRLAPTGGHLAEAEELAREVLANPPSAVRTIVRSKRAALQVLEAQVNVVTRERRLQSGPDFAESVAALRERRPPKVP